MIFGFQIYNFQIRYGVKGKTLAEVKACRQPEPYPGKFFTLENKDAAIEQLGPNELKMLYTFFTGKELNPFPRYLVQAYPRVKGVFDEKKLDNAKGFKVPPFSDQDEPLPVHSAKMKPIIDAIPETNKNAKAYKPERTPDDDARPEETTTEGSNSAPEDSTDETENEDMATKKAAKKSGKKAAAKKAPVKKAPAKKTTANGSGKRGRASRYADTQKIKALVKENPCLKEFKGQPTNIWKSMDIILKHPNITFADYVKKGGRSDNLWYFERHKQAAVTKA